MTTVDNQGNITGNAFVVVVNDRGQHALWQAGISRPAGWRQQSAAMSRQACLDAIAAGSPETAPAGPRGAAGPGFASGRPGTPSVHERFAEQASRRPDAAAIIAAGSRLTYRELDQSANRLAHYLKDMCAGPGTLIGMHADRGVEAVRSLLAIMKAGSGYLPPDPSLPPARLARICAETRPIAILAARPTPLAPPDGPLNPPGRIPGAGTRLLALRRLT